jgi:hypothetical protein
MLEIFSLYKFCKSFVFFTESGLKRGQGKWHLYNAFKGLQDLSKQYSTIKLRGAKSLLGTDVMLYVCAKQLCSHFDNVVFNIRHVLASLLGWANIHYTKIKVFIFHQYCSSSVAYCSDINTLRMLYK